MKKLLLVSHGNLALGLHDSLKMFVGDREDILSIGFTEENNIDKYVMEFTKLVETNCSHGEVIVLGDIIGGSPLTMAVNILSDLGLIDTAIILGGMNLPLALASVLMKDNLSRNEFVTYVLAEAREALKPLQLKTLQEDEI